MNGQSGSDANPKDPTQKVSRSNEGTSFIPRGLEDHFPAHEAWPWCPVDVRVRANARVGRRFEMFVARGRLLGLRERCSGCKSRDAAPSPGFEHERVHAAMSRASPPPRRGDARLAVARIATVRG